MGVVGRLDQYASMLAWEFDETTANNPSITGLGTYYASEFNENIVDIVRNGLVLNLDAGNLASYPGSGTTWTDLSGLGNNGTLTNGPTYSSSNGGSINFSGSNQSVNLGTFFTYQTFTINLWVNAGSTQNTYANIFDNNHTGFRNFTMQQDASTTNAYGFGVNDATGGISGASFTLTSGIWTNITITFTPSDRVILYLNGVFSSQGGLAGGRNIFYQSQTLNLARWGGDTARGWNGRISNFSVYNRVLSASEIQQNYNALATRYGLATTNSTAPMSANVFPPYDPVYDEFGGTLFGAGQGRYMRQNTDKSVIVYNEIDEITTIY